MEATQKEWHTILEIAAKLGVHYSTVRKMIDRGEIRAHRVGNMWRISEKAYQEFMDKERQVGG